MATVILVRHGRTTANASGVLAGRTAGVRLDDVGPPRPQRAGERLAVVPLVGGREQPAGALPADGRGDRRGAGRASRRGPTERGITECDYGEWQGRALKDAGQGAALEDRADPAVGGGLPRRRVDGRRCRPARSPPYAAATPRSRPSTAPARCGWRSATATSSSRCSPTRSACTSTCSSGSTSTRRRSRSSATPRPARTCWPPTPTPATCPGCSRRRPKKGARPAPARQRRRRRRRRRALPGVLGAA